MKQYGQVQRGLLGISGKDVRDYLDEQKAQQKEVDLGTNDGVYVDKVTEGGSA